MKEDNITQKAIAVILGVISILLAVFAVPEKYQPAAITAVVIGFSLIILIMFRKLFLIVAFLLSPFAGGGITWLFILSITNPLGQQITAFDGEMVVNESMHSFLGIFALVYWIIAILAYIVVIRKVLRQFSRE